MGSEEAIMAFAKGENPHRPRKGDSIRVEPIRSKRHIANIKKILADKPRDLCLFTLGINTAFRANELLAIKVGQVRYLEVGDMLTIKQRKTQKYRSVVLNETVIATIRNYLRQTPLSDEDHLFMGLRGCLTVPTVNRLVETWWASVGLQGNYGSHSMCKTWGYWQRQNGADILNLVEAFGHATQRQTMAYLGLQPEDGMKLYDLNL
jgi:integrase